MVDLAAMRRFADAVQRPEEDVELDRAALLLGEWEGPIDVPRYRAMIDELADRAELARRELADRSFAGCRAVSRVLFAELGFHGNAEDYYDPRNSFLAEVLERRTGIPITLSVLYMEVARRIGVRINGLGFPGHFLVRALDGDRSVVIDPFNRGAVLGREELEELLARVAGPDARLDPSHLAPLGKIQILTRMLVNLAGVYGKAGDLFRSLEVLERLHLLDTENPKISQDLENLRRRCDSLN